MKLVNIVFWLLRNRNLFLFLFVVLITDVFTEKYNTIIIVLNNLQFIMNNLQKQKIFIDTNWGLFIGTFSDNIPHKHFATQISVTINKKITFFDENNNAEEYKNCIIKNNTLHNMSCQDTQLMLLISPTSSIGHYLNSVSSQEKDISDFTNDFTAQLKKHALEYINAEIDFKNLIEKVRELLKTTLCECPDDNHFNDDRIKMAIAHLEQHSDAIIPLEKIAEICHLSPSRFLHLFRKKTGISYRRIQLWNKIWNSFNHLTTQSITQTAHQFGFTDSAHYSRIFKETFGFPPSYISKIE